MAGSDPETVASILASLETANAGILWDIVKAAQAMPSKYAALLAPVISRAANSGQLWMAFVDAAELCATLARGDQPGAALELAEGLFGFAGEEDDSEVDRRTDQWFRRGLKVVVPALAETAPELFLPMMSTWLTASLLKRPHTDLDSGEDFSYSWRPAIEEHDQNHGHDVSSTLLGALRWGFEKAIDKGRASLQEALMLLEPYQLLAFKRLRLWLLVQYGGQDPSLVRRTLLDKTLFDDYRYRHEYSLLAGKHLPLLAATEEVAAWYGWIDAGPDMSEFDLSFKERLGREPTQADRQARIDYWKFERLHWVRGYLTGERKQFYERMLADNDGEPELADMVSKTTMRSGFESPMALDHFTGRSLGDVVNEIKGWTPDPKHQHWGPSIEGLADTFGQFVNQDVVGNSSQSKILQGTPAILIRKFLARMVEGVRGEKPIDIAGVLGLCEWVANRPVEERTTPVAAHQALADPDWQWTRDEITEFIQAVCTAQTNNHPRYGLAGLRERMWALLDKILRDRSKSYIVRDTSKDDLRLKDYLDLGINSPRGRAVQAALEYARWVANHIKTGQPGREVISGGLDSMPEVRSMLEWQIDPRNRCIETMAVIGSKVGLIYWIGKDWLIQRKASMFDLAEFEREPSNALGWTAWNAFLVWVPPHIALFDALKEQFAYAVNEAARVPSSGGANEGGPMEHLGEHLSLLYGRGQVSLPDHDGIVRRFFSDAVPRLRRHAIGFIGRLLSGDQLPPDVIERLQTLWDLYWQGPGPADAKEEPDAWMFGQWFASGQFPVAWSLPRLRAYADIVGLPEPDHDVAEKLAEIADSDVAASLAILKNMIYGDKEGWHVQGWLKSAESILKAGLVADAESRRVAVELVNVLGRRGHVELGALLKP